MLSAFGSEELPGGEERRPWPPVRFGAAGCCGDGLREICVWHGPRQSHPRLRTCVPRGVFVSCRSRWCWWSSPSRIRACQFRPIEGLLWWSGGARPTKFCWDRLLEAGEFYTESGPSAQWVVSTGACGDGPTPIASRNSGQTKWRGGRRHPVRRGQRQPRPSTTHTTNQRKYQLVTTPTHTDLLTMPLSSQTVSTCLEAVGRTAPFWRAV